MWRSRWLPGSVALGLVLAATQEVDAVPSFSRQTGMTCNQCHVSFGGPVPNFTFTGKKFRMNGYRMPFVADKLEAGEPGAPDGKRLSIPLIPYLSFRYQSVFASQSKAPGAEEAGPITSNPTNRLAIFPGGALGDNFGLWIELYLTPDGTPNRDWGFGAFSFDEYDLRLVKITDNSTLGLSFSNQSIREISGFGPWPTIGSNLTRGGFGGWSHPNRGNFFAYGWFADRLLATIGASPGEDNLDWDERNYQGQLAYALLNSDENEAWVNVMAQFGNDGIPIITNTTPATNRTWTYRDIADGISALRTGTNANKPYMYSDVGDYFRVEPEVRYGFIDRGPHSMEVMARLVFANETYADNAEAKQSAFGTAVRYMFDRTWGGDLMLFRNNSFTYTDPSGAEHDIKTSPSWTAYLKYQPAMNFILNLSFGNVGQTLLQSPGAPTVQLQKGWSWSLSSDILF